MNERQVKTQTGFNCLYLKSYYSLYCLSVAIHCSNSLPQWCRERFDKENKSSFLFIHVPSLLHIQKHLNILLILTQDNPNVSKKLISKTIMHKNIEKPFFIYWSWAFYILVFKWQGVFVSLASYFFTNVIEQHARQLIWLPLQWAHYCGSTLIVHSGRWHLGITAPIFPLSKNLIVLNLEQMNVKLLEKAVENIRNAVIRLTWGPKYLI